ncbi:MAG: transglycosylase SLT domain-containing protein [Gemmatimonadota bacterium]|nr:MAG: transglycosylase SLT domain-containing protein [Gemmatimonadota bacterium]
MAKSVSLAVLTVVLWSGGAGQMSAQGTHSLEADSARWHEVQRLRGLLAGDSAGPAVILRLAVLELAIGRPERARELLTRGSTTALWPAEITTPLLGDADYQLGAFEMAAALFDEAALHLKGQPRGVMLARAADSYERSGRTDVAADRYAWAATELPELKGWLAVREARVTPDSARAMELLSLAPAAASRLSLEAQAEIKLAAADTSAAVDAFTQVGLPARAATLALARADSVSARELANEALSDSDTAVVRLAVGLLSQLHGPRTSTELRELARAYRRIGSTREGLDAAGRAVASDSTDVDALVYWADLLEITGSRTQALEVYRRAASFEGAAARSAAYKYGRLFVRMRRTAEARAALTAFADSFPQDPNAPVALHLVADGFARARQTVAADSVRMTLSQRWPRSSYASRARLKLASNALARGDTAGAIGWYSDEVELGGAQRFAAQYQVASLTSDALERRGILAVLARADSVGYYGTIARQESGLPPLNVASPSSPPEPRALPHEFLVLDLLRDVRYEAEAEALVEHIMSEQTRPPAELLDYAEGLIERGLVAEGIRLGWRATRAYTLNHPRVLRVIFPWPLREMIEEESRAHGLDPYLLAALIRQESSFRASVVSHAGAYGLMQLMPPTARQLAQRQGMGWDRRLLVVADANLHLGAVHLASLLERYDGRVELALAAYNAGGTPVRRWLRYPNSDDPVQFVAQVPYPETQGYLRTVIRNRALYKALYPPAELQAAGTP